MPADFFGLGQACAITPDPDLDEDDLDMFMEMVGAVCEVERIDADGTLLTLVGLEPRQMAKVAA